MRNFTTDEEKKGRKAVWKMSERAQKYRRNSGSVKIWEYKKDDRSIRYAIKDKGTYLDDLTKEELERYLEGQERSLEEGAKRIATEAWIDEQERKGTKEISAPTQCYSIVKWVTVVGISTANDLKLYDALRVSLDQFAVRQFSIHQLEEALETLDSSYNCISVEKEFGLVMLSGYVMCAISENGVNDWILPEVCRKYKDKTIDEFLNGEKSFVFPEEFAWI